MFNHRPLRVLLVEDHPSTRTALSIWLSDLGHEVEAVETVAAALNFAKKFTFDLLISDIGLPDGNGRDLLGKLRENHDFHAVAITGNSGTAESELSYRAGFAQHLEKPVDLDALTEILGTAAEGLVD
jgi:CheY-like chemotaxis protein